MQMKLFEVRDRATCIPVGAIQLGSTDPHEQRLITHAGYGPPAEQSQYLLLFRLDSVGNQISYDPFFWGRTLGEAHSYIAAHFDALQTGSVIDIEFILGETRAPKTSEI